MRTLLICTVLFLLPDLLRAQTAALVIGHGSPQRIEEATAVAEALRAITPDADVRLLVGADATSSSARNSLLQLLTRRPADVLVYAATEVALRRYPSGSEAGWLLLEGSRVPDQPSEIPGSALALQPLTAQLAASSARRAVLALDTRFAGLAVPESPVNPDTFLAVIGGSAADSFPLGQAISGADSYEHALARLLGVESAIRLSLQPARSIDRALRSTPTSATLVLPPLPQQAQVIVDGKEVAETRIPLAEGDHLLHVMLNGTDLWRMGMVLTSGETRVLAQSVETQHPVRLVPNLGNPATKLFVNGTLTPPTGHDPRGTWPSFIDREAGAA